MDHIWIDREAQKSPELVPVIAKVQYDNAEFDTFLRRCGVDADALKKSAFRFHGKSDSGASSVGEEQLQKLSIVQEWLFFGLINEVGRILGTKIQRADLIREIRGSQIIWTANLPRVLEKAAEPILERYLHRNSDKQDVYNVVSNWHGVKVSEAQNLQRYYKDLPPFQKLRLHWSTAFQETEHLGQLLQELSWKCRTFLRSCLSFSGSDEPAPLAVNIWVSAFVLAETIAEFAEKVFRVVRRPVRFKVDHFWVRRALVNGLCPTKVFREVSNVTTLYLTTSIRGDQVIHNDCKYGRWTTSNSCSAVADRDQLPFHRSHAIEYRCENITPNVRNYDEVKQILTRGSYPICEFLEKEHQSMELRFFDCAAEERGYVAISHVW